MSAIAKKVVDHVVIGGGITGAATAFHLRRLQPKSNVLLVEREHALGCGQSAHSAGIVVHAHKCEMTSALAWNTTRDVERILSSGRRRLGSWKPKHGTFDARDYFVDVNGLVQDYVKSSATGHDATGSLEVAIGTEVVGMEEGNIIMLQNAQALLQAEVKERIYNCTGMDSPQMLARLLGEDGIRTVGFANLRSHYWEFFVSNFKAERIAVARKDSGFSELSLVYLPGMYLKFSQNNSKIEIGVQEKESVVVQNIVELLGSGHGPVDLLYEQDDTLAEFLGSDFLECAELRAYVSGVSTYSPDGKPVIAQNGNIISAAGCCGYGVSWAGGLGKLLAEVGSGIGMLPEEFDARRFAGWDMEKVQKGAVAFRHNKVQGPTASSCGSPNVLDACAA